MPEVRRVFDEHLDVAREPSLTIRSVYGRYFPWFRYLDRDWAQTQSRASSRPSQRARPCVAWETYLLFCQPYRDVLPILRAQYTRAAATAAGYDPDGKDGLAQSDAWVSTSSCTTRQDTIALDDALLVEFFRSASDAVRGHAIEYVGRSLANTTQELAPAIAHRLRELWAWRLRAAQDSGNVMASREELAAFGWWFASRKLDDAWSMPGAHGA